MPTTLDCEVLRDLYGSEEVRRAFDSRALVQAWLDVERALAEAEAEIGVIPVAAAERIAREADASLYDLAALRRGIAESQHPLVPLVRALAARCGDDGDWVHWGATTQDVIDTGTVLQVRAALEPIKRDLGRATAAAAALAGRYAETPMAGRTHGQHAVPITFGLKAASWTDELRRVEERLRNAEAAVLTGQLGGAAGTLAALGSDAAAVRSAFCRRLGLAEPEVSWHAARDRIRDLGHALAEAAAAGERIASEIIRLQATEVAELSEPVADGHVGSSTMPQKRNPMVCEYVVATARLLRGATGVLADAPAHLHERDMGAWAAEWIALPQALILAGGLSGKLAAVLEGLLVDTEQMWRNLALSRGQIMAEAVMMTLAQELGHERAHGVVARAAGRATAEGTDFALALLDDPDIAELLGSERVAQALDPAGYLGLAGAHAAAVAASTDEVA